MARSSNALIALIILGGIAICRLHSDMLIIGIFGLGVGVYLVWYFRTERFAYKHPLEALLEGGEYTAHQQMLMATKGEPSIPLEALGVPTPGVTVPTGSSNGSEKKS